MALFRKALKRWLQPATHSREVAWFRTFEWTPGNDGRGHPHFHWWLLCPYLELDVIRDSWAQALRTADIAFASVPRVIVDVRAVRNGEGAANEVIKYLTKDILPDRQLVDPVVFGQVYAALDGRRVTQASAGFFKNLDQAASCECGATGMFKRSNTRPEGTPSAGHGGEAKGSNEGDG